METYKVIFAKNIVLSCHIVSNPATLQGEYYCEYDSKGMPIYAIVKAGSKEEAISIAEKISTQITGNSTTRKHSKGDELPK